MSKMIRIQFELPEDKVDELEELMRGAGISTKKDLLNNAVTLFDWAINEKKSGNVIASINERTGRIKELVMPALAFAETTNSREEILSPMEMADTKADAGELRFAENAV